VAVRIHPHAIARMLERGATQDEVTATVEGGAQFPARFGRTGIRRNFAFAGEWRGRTYGTKQVEVFAVLDGGEWLAITVLVKYF
jgi:chemotaxis receptor (MCP) glutamine deamidase CheD